MYINMIILLFSLELVCIASNNVISNGSKIGQWRSQTKFLSRGQLFKARLATDLVASFFKLKWGDQSNVSNS